MIRCRFFARLAVRLACAALLTPLAPPRPPAYGSMPRAGMETVEQAACRMIEGAARSAKLPVALLTRLVWTESRFRAGAVSPKGAQGIAQFMPDTAAQRGLADPFDPEQAIPAAAALLVSLDQRFGNLGLAAAAYNAGAARVAAWLAGSGGLPVETQSYVLSVTGRSADDWAKTGRVDGVADGASCLDVTASLRSEEGSGPAPIAPWGVQLSGNFSKALALVSFERSRARYAGILGQVRPMVIGGRLLSRGWRPFYRVLVPAASRAEADRVCASILAGGGACVAIRTS